MAGRGEARQGAARRGRAWQAGRYVRGPKGNYQEGFDMLVLRRKVGEKIVIGDGVVVTVLETGSHIVRLGIEAPRDVAVHRQEVADRIAALARSGPQHDV